ADVGCRAADRRALGVRGTGRTRAVAVLLEVADAGCATARGAGRFEPVGRTVVADAVAALVDVADVGGGAADGRALGVRGTDRTRPVAVLFEVAGAGCGTTGGAGRLEPVGRTVVPDAVAALRHVANARCGPADRGALGIGGTVDARPGAVFRQVAHAGSGPTDGSGGLELAARGAAIPVRHVPIVALLGGLDGAVAAHGCGEGHDGRCPVVAAGGARPVGQVAPGHGHLAEFGLDRDVCVRGAGRA